MRRSLWPQSLFGRLIAATICGVLLAQGASVYLVGRNEQHVVTDVATRLWARRISEITFILTQLPPRERVLALRRLRVRGRFGPHRPWRWRGIVPHHHGPFPGARGVRRPHHLRAPWLVRELHTGLRIRLPFHSDAPGLLLKRLHAELGNAYHVRLSPPDAPPGTVIRIAPAFAGRVDHRTGGYDVHVDTAGSPTLIFRVARISPWVALPPSLLLNLTLLVVVLIAALYVAARGITRPLSQLARAAESVGAGTRSARVPEQGAREVRHAARAFNSMQERLHRYLDSRTAVLAAMSHDLKTPLTRLRLQVETLIEDPTLRARLGHELDEMESMVRGALALFRGVDDEEHDELVDINALIESIRGGFADMGHQVSVTGRAVAPFRGRPQALKRCLTNLVSNAVKFGERAHIVVEDGAALRIVVSDEGPGIPPDALERVFEPFFRLESSRNRDTGGTGLGLSIARDVAQAHGGMIRLRNRPEGGLEAELNLPRG